MKVTTLKPFPANSNPYNHDIHNMGCKIGSNCTIMMKNFDKDECDYLIIVNTKTGERIRVDLK